MMPSEVIVLSVERDLIDGSLFVLARDKVTGDPLGAFDTVEHAGLELGSIHDLELGTGFDKYDDDDLRASQVLSLRGA